jgi:predicted DNA-binding transcriptional regulator YafY
VRLASRPPLARLLAIDAAIGNGSYPTATALALQLEVSPRTIYRDIDLLRDQLQAPVIFDPRRNGYCYTEPNYRLPAVRLTEGELVALAVAERVLQQYRGTSFEADLRQAFARICGWLPESVTVDLAALGDCFSVQPAATDLLDLETFRVLTEGVRRRRQLTIRYWTASRNATGQRRVDPYHLTLLKHDWYLIGLDHQSRQVRTFKAVRVRAARPTGATFDVPADFDINNYLGDSFRALRGSGRHRVALRFSARVAGQVAEKHWHRTQETESMPGGELLLRFQLSELREVKAWVLSWGREVEVLEPAELREMVREELREMARQYR